MQLPEAKTGSSGDLIAAGGGGRPEMSERSFGLFESQIGLAQLVQRFRNVNAVGMIGDDRLQPISRLSEIVRSPQTLTSVQQAEHGKFVLKESGTFEGFVMCKRFVELAQLEQRFRLHELSPLDQRTVRIGRLLCLECGGRRFEVLILEQRPAATVVRVLGSLGIIGGRSDMQVTLRRRGEFAQLELGIGQLLPSLWQPATLRIFFGEQAGQRFGFLNLL